jgi:hypothetical protein
MTPIVETITGKFVHLLEPEVSSIVLEDIAYPLSRIARYNGHTLGTFQYSVAQHSLWCAWIAQKYFKTAPATTLKVLLHDAHEAYTGDLITPLKRQLQSIDDIQARLQAVIHQALNVQSCNDDELEVISIVDGWAIAVESFYLRNNRGKHLDVPMPEDKLFKVWGEPVVPMQAYRMFIHAYMRLSIGEEMLSPCA